MDIVERLRRMSDMTTTDNDLTDIAKAANEIELLRKERDGLRETLHLIAEHPVEKSQQWEVGAKEMQKLARAALKENS